MAQESIRVYFTMVDGASQVMATIGDQTKVLDKERPPPGGGGGSARKNKIAPDKIRKNCRNCSECKKL